MVCLVMFLMKALAIFFLVLILGKRRNNHEVVREDMLDTLGRGEKQWDLILGRLFGKINVISREFEPVQLE